MRDAPKPKPQEIDIAVKPIKEVKQRLGILESERTMIHSWIQNSIQPLRDRIKKLEAERGSGLEYLGVWQEHKEYSVGQFVTLNGGIFFCRESTTSRPGTGGAWQLAVKSGGGR
jgi:hypothetical protein